MGSVIDHGHTPLPRMFVRQSTHDITSASGRKWQSQPCNAQRVHYTPLQSARSSNTDWACGALNRPANIPSRGRTAANKKNRNQRRTNDGYLTRKHASRPTCPMKRARESILDAQVAHDEFRHVIVGGFAMISSGIGKLMDTTPSPSHMIRSDNANASS